MPGQRHVWIASVAALLSAAVLAAAQETPPRERLSEARRTECLEEFERMSKKLGANVRLSPSDKEMVDVCTRATDVHNVQDLADSREATLGIKPEVLRDVQQAGNRLMRSFNDRGANASFPSADVEFLLAFIEAAKAVECLSASKDPQRVAGISPEIVRNCVDAASRVLSDFNQRGKEARFSGSDRQALQRMQDALRKK